MLRNSQRWHILKLPGRKCLDDICKVDLLRMATPEKVINIWLDHHKQFVQYYGRVVNTEAYNAMRPRLSASRYFVVPLFREKGLFNVVTNFSDDDVVGVVPLAEFQKHRDRATVHMTLQFFTELSSSKNLVLMRCEIQDKVLNRQDCMFLSQMLIKYYTLPNLYSAYVETFNKRPHAFDYHAFLRHMKDEAQRDDIAILDKKSEMQASAYSTANILSRSGSSAAAAIQVPTATQSKAILHGHTKSQDSS